MLYTDYHVFGFIASYIQTKMRTAGRALYLEAAQWNRWYGYWHQKDPQGWKGTLRLISSPRFHTPIRTFFHFAFEPNSDPGKLHCPIPIPVPCVLAHNHVNL
ncbi:predicted protein [Sclerotinia sclerotiorum 1980 UF-70]|uniref:Uncharacterized protein n=1 Tax=Sclerotinia sclerotiorum (strain ATCC 18683 / 1980 / Ss-1) TaxID=665079 RepID=A7F107_SCLS1|nr:predicted protein [Sclerotinia sclerotiorum 1980 UF-70]EDN95399.1 predicted protein [Sclerotinia sclerotiorum 1980 UF-70]